MKKLFLVDVSSLFFRAFYAVRPLTSPSGLPTNAIYGYLSMILKLLKDEKPEYIAFCYDRKEPSFRKGLYEEYKANRTEMPEDLVPQIPYIKKLATVLGIPAFEVPDYEADDLIGTLARLGQKNKMEVFIVSGDKDFGQLIQDHTYLYDTMKSSKIDAKGVKEKWGVPPEQFIDFLAIVGDSSDNVPGVHGLGPKGAQKLLEEYGTLEKIYENIDKIKGSTKEKLEKAKDEAFLSKKLVTIVTDVPMSDKMSDYRRKPFDRTEVTNLMAELNFKTLEKNIWPLDFNSDEAASESSSVSTVSSEPTPTVVIETEASQKWPIVEIAISQLKEHLPKGSEIWGFSTERGLFVSDTRTVYQLQGTPQELGLLDAEMKWQWKGFDLKGFWHLIQAKDPIAAWDSQLAAYVLKPGDSMEFERVVARILGEVPMDLPSGADILNWQVKLEKNLREKMKQTHVETVYEKLDLPLAHVLFKMEQRGIYLDRDLLAGQSAELGKEIKVLEEKIHTTAGETFNIGSPKQISQILFEKLKLTPGKKTKTGFSTDNEVLEKLKKEHPIADLILDYRELTKLKSTYVDALPQLVKEDGRIHSTFNQALTATGRLSSIDPNLQNIPIRTERGARVRKAFSAEKGKLLLSVDYSQIELRILAHYSEDPNLIRAFQEDLDIHAATAAEVFGVKVSDVTSEQRRAAKAVNFGIAYGQGAFGLAENLGIPRSEASDIIKRYFAKFSRVQNYIEDTIASAKEKGYVETLDGRRRYIDELKSGNGMIQKFGERAAINAPIQGTAADIVKKAMLEIDEKIELPMLLQVHDELIFEGSKAQVDKEKAPVVSIMENIVKLRVPLKANAAVGMDWDSAE